MKRVVIVLLVIVDLMNAEFIRDSAKEVVLDTSTHLMWQDSNDSNSSIKQWEDAITYCENLNFAGYSDWHLPNVNELYSLANRRRYNPAIASVFVYVAISTNDKYWSSTTTNSLGFDYAWYVEFRKGTSNKLVWNIIDNTYVRCVRLVEP